MAHIRALCNCDALEDEVLRGAACDDAGQLGELPAGAAPDLAEAAPRKLLLQCVAADLIPAAYAGQISHGSMKMVKAQSRGRRYAANIASAVCHC